MACRWPLPRRNCAAVPDLTSEDGPPAPPPQYAVRQAKLLADDLVASSPPGTRRCASEVLRTRTWAPWPPGPGQGHRHIVGQDLRGFTAWTAHRGYRLRVPTLSRKVRIMMDWLARPYQIFRRDLLFGSIAGPGAASPRRPGTTDLAAAARYRRRSECSAVDHGVKSLSA